MKHINEFFISHDSRDSKHALALYDLLKTINPQWKIFLDCKDIETYDEWHSAMFGELEASKHLIFVSSSADYLKEGNGWMYEEISNFQILKATRNRRNTSGQNISYFGVFMGKIDFEKSLFSDPDRGSEYRRLYERPEHLVLSENETIADAAERIKNKILSSICRETNEVAADILDRVKLYAEKRETDDIMFSRRSVSDILLPSMSEGEKNVVNFNGLCSMLSTSNLGILGSEGGSGKTSLLTRIFYHYLDKADLQTNVGECMIPIYIDARTLAAENHLILRYVAQTLYGEYTAMTEKFTGGTISYLHREFSTEASSPRYLIIIDGYNEIPVNYLKTFDKELIEFLQGGIYKNVRIVISGRYLSDIVSDGDFRFLHLKGLGYKRIEKYLTRHKLRCPDPDSSLFHLLTVPMYLKMYAHTSGGEHIKNKADLLLKFINWQREKDMASSNSDEHKAQLYILLYHALPLLAHRMVMTKAAQSQFAITSDEIADIYASDIDVLKNTSYKRYFGSEYRENLRISRFADTNCYDEFDLMDISVEYFTKNSKLLRKNVNGGYEFVHQIYRDFFCAWFIAGDIKRSAEGETSCEAISQSFMDNDVKSFVAELLNEPRVFFDKQNEKWDFSCNKSSDIISLIDLCRGKGDGKNPIYVANLIELIKVTRANNLAECDFSELDLTQSNLQGCSFSRYDEIGVHSTKFTNATIDRYNLMCPNHSFSIRYACVYDDMLASVDSGGVIKLWSLSQGASKPVKTISTSYNNIKKMIFSNDGASLYGMTAHEIIELNLSNQDSANSDTVVIYKTAKRLKNISFSDNGELCFTTVFNAFNSKPVSNPDIPDVCEFYGLNSCADVRKDGAQLVFGNVSCYYGLKLYNYISEKKEWREQKLGYSYLLERYILKLEATLKSFKLYHVFDDEDNRQKHHQRPHWAVRSSYFTCLQMGFEDRVHFHENVPKIILEKILKELSYKKINLYPKQLNKLKEIAERYEQRLWALHLENPLLFFVSCHKIYSAEYKGDSETVLLSCVNKHTDKEIYDSIVIEFNTRTQEIHYVTRFKGVNPLRAWYSGNTIIVSRGYRVDIYDFIRGNINSLFVSHTAVTNMLNPANKDYFYALSGNFIYEFNTDGICTKSFRNNFGTSNLAYVTDTSGNGYIAKSWEVKALKAQKRKVVLEPLTGRYLSLMCDFESADKVEERIIADIGNRNFKVSSNNLIVFENEIKISQTPIQYNLFVCGCDFRGIKGELANPDDLKILQKFGAVCDALAEEEKIIEYETRESYALQSEFRNIEDKPLIYSYNPDTLLKVRNLYETPVESKVSHLKNWLTIHWGSYSMNGLEAADYSILEWVNRLTFVTGKMIYDLTQAGLIDKPTNYKLTPEKLSGHLSKSLHKRYKLLDRRVFCTDTEESRFPIYTLSKKYGLELLKRTEDSKVFKTLSGKPYTNYEARSMLAVNNWLCSNLNTYKEHISDYAVECVFDTDHHYCGRASIDGYIKLGSQSFFVQGYRVSESGNSVQEITGKMERLCHLATYYKSLTRSGVSKLIVSKQPIIVLICENYDHCVEINEIVKNIYPDVRKIFTYDGLVNCSMEDIPVSRHFEFVDGEAYAVDIGEMIL